MFYIHPITQLLGTVLAVYVFILGWPRLRAAFANDRAFFAWKRHVRLGLTAVIVLFFGMIGGAVVASHYRGDIGLTGGHYWIALGMVPLMLFSLASGLIMDRKKARRKTLPLLHGLGNLALVAFALLQAWTGFGVLRAFIL